MSNDDWQIVPERDEAIQRKRGTRPADVRATRAGDAQGSDPKGGKTAAGKAGASRTRARVGSSAWLFLLILVSFGFNGYLLYQLQFLQADQGQVSQRVSSLEGRLSVTDESLSESGAAMQALLQDHAAELELHMSEIRKLWGVAYDTNRKNIEALQTSLSGIRSQLQSLSDEVDNAGSQVASRVDSLGSELLILSADVEDVLGRIRETRDELNQQQRNLSQLQAAGQDTSAAIQSIDSFRQQINQRLIQLENEVRALSNPAP